jgi:hypothetical protein
MTRNPAPGELRGCPQDVRSRVEPHQGVPAIEKKDALFAPGLAFRSHVQKKRSIVGSKQRFAREIPGRRLRISDRMTAREHELHGFGPSRCLPPSEPILVNKSLPATVAGVALRPKFRAQHRQACGGTVELDARVNIGELNRNRWFNYMLTSTRRVYKYTP